MMTSTQCYIFGIGLLNQPSSGNLTITRFDDFFNRAQVEYQKEILKGKDNVEIMANRSLSPFFTEQAVLLTNGIGQIPAPLTSMAFGPVLWSSGYSNPTCGTAATGDPELIPVELEDAGGWADRSRNMVDGVSAKNPYARIKSGTTLEVRPRALRFVTAWYVRYPKAAFVGSFVDANGIVRPQEGASNQVDPEWADYDLIEIIWKAMGYTGLALKDRNMQATAQGKEAMNVR